jgi:hypothetical protein
MEIVKYIFLSYLEIGEESTDLTVMIFNRPNEYADYHLQVHYQKANRYHFLSDKEFYSLVYDLLNNKSININLPDKDKEITKSINISPGQSTSLDILNMTIDFSSILSEEASTILSRWNDSKRSYHNRESRYEEKDLQEQSVF